jgi:hypothetical protein
VLIRGTVTDVDGTPIEWAAVWFAGGDHPTQDIAAVTDASGSFTLTAPAAGSYRLGCNAAGHDGVEIDVEVTADDIEVLITLPLS